MTTTAISSSLLGISTSSSTDTTSSTATTTTDFISLLLAELENQDPTDPMDTAELTSQFASLTLVEQSIKTNEYLETLSQYSSSINSASALSLIDKTVTADTSGITLSDGASQTLSFTLQEEASMVSVAICDKEGNLVRTIDAGSLSPGTNTVTWDATDSSGDTVDDGTYSFKVIATDSDGKSVTASTSVTETIASVLYSGGATYLVTSNGSKIAYGDVTAVGSN